MIRPKISLTVQNSNPPKVNFSKAERKAFRELKFDTLIVLLPADRGRLLLPLTERIT